MKKTAFSVCLALLLVLSMGLALAGCSQEGRGFGANTAKKTGEFSGTITVAGSSSVQPFSEVLAEAFMDQNPKVKVNVQGGGSSQGIEAARSGAAQIGASSRELKPEEKGFHQFLIARDGIAVIVHPSNPVADIKIAQLRQIFQGGITNWKDVGGKDAEITLVNREAGSGTRDGFETLIMDKAPISNKALIFNSTGAIKSMVMGDPRAIGYISLVSVDDSIKTLKIDGVEPTSENIVAGRYQVARPFIYLTTTPPTGVAKAFIDYVLSEAGQKILEDEGVVRVK